MGVRKSVTPSRGDVVMVSLDPTMGHEQGGQRPALVVSSDSMNLSPAGLVVVVPITGTDRGIPTHIKLSSLEGGLTKPSVIMADQIRTISKLRVARRMGVVSTSTMDQVDYCLKLVLDLS